MGNTKIEVILGDELLTDIDSLIQAGFYKDRDDIIFNALMGIEPLKLMHDRRWADQMKKMIPVIKPIFGIAPHFP